LAHTHKGSYDRAIQDFDHALRLKPNSAAAFYDRGRAYGYKRDYDRAIQDYDEAVRLNPSDADSYYGRGMAYSRKGDYERAIQDYDQAIRLNARLAVAFRNRSLAHAQKREYLRAIADSGHFLWLKFGILGITIRVCLLALAVAFGFALKRFRKGRKNGQQSKPGTAMPMSETIR
jgi:tetratricopeptide (TPR) repeat protein